MFKAKKAFRKFFKFGKKWLIKLINIAFDVGVSLNYDLL